MSLPPPPLEPRPPDAQMLGYANPLELPRKPGILDTLGIMSIVVASIGILASIAFMFGAVRVRPVVRTWQVQSPPTAAQLAEVRAQASQNLARTEQSLERSVARARDRLVAAQTQPGITATELATLERYVATGESSLDRLRSNSGRSPATTTTSPAPLPPTAIIPPPLPRPRAVVSTPLIDWPSTMVLVAIELVSVAIAGYLLFCGVIVVQNSPRGYWHHINYARLKVMLVLGSLLAVIGTSVIGKESGQVGVITTILVMTGWIYPIAVLITMRRPNVIRYYRSQMGRRTGT